MPTAHTIVLFMTAGLALNLTPGPDMLFVAAQGTGGGRRTGLAAAAGIFLGCMVHIGAVAFGLAALLARVPAAYEAVRWAGAAYSSFSPSCPSSWTLGVRPGPGRALQRITGGVFVALGVRLALLERR